ncbi:MAG: cadmium-translocating P-type ATPase [Rhizobiaceae bacterium]|nr:cadmium-translocating P-type ATPase [Rhizobiaceae bacterium]
MSCCAPGAEAGAGPVAGTALSADEIRLASRPLGDGLMQTDLSVPTVHCGACIHTIEKALGRLDGVESARVNLSSKRVAIKWRDGKVPPFAATLEAAGYASHLYSPGENGRDAVLAELIRAVAVAGFAAGNIMLLSVSVWSGADGATRDLFHWISALIALPALAYAGRVFFRSAWSALRHGRMNMDVPIAIGVSLAYALSFYETLNHGQHAYFDAAVTLLFFLLIGRTLDHVMRERARSAVAGLAKLTPAGAMIRDDDGSHRYLPLAEIAPGMSIIVAVGERVPVDGVITEGATEFDRALVTGESVPQRATPGAQVQAGVLNMGRPVTVQATAAAKDSFLAEMVRMMEAAEGGRARYRRIADRASSLYAPVVHLAAFLTFLWWMFATGDWHRAITIAIAVLIITCPCALGLAVPIVQVVAARRLFEHGVMVRDGSGLERLADIDHAVFDKTGTLTTGVPVLRNAGDIPAQGLSIAAALAAQSRHPYSRAVAAVADVETFSQNLKGVLEVTGNGVEAEHDGTVWRLGRAAWACGEDVARGTVLSRDGQLVARFEFAEQVRPGAEDAVAWLHNQGVESELVSGDRDEPVDSIADRLAIWRRFANMQPGDKTKRLVELAQEGRRVLMVGDGLNDAPALAAAHVSMAPATAADVGRNAADFVFLRDSLSAISEAVATARRAADLIRQNFALAIAYNILAVPIAIFGYVTPLVAAVAMSLSSLLVIANAMRLVMNEASLGGPADKRHAREFQQAKVA